MTPRTTEFLISAIGDIDDAEALNRIVRKCSRQLKKLGVQPPLAPVPQVLHKEDLKPDDLIVIGTENGEKTRAKVLKVNAKRVKVELLSKRGKKRPQRKGSVIYVYPEMLRARA